MSGFEIAFITFIIVVAMAIVYSVKGTD